MATYNISVGDQEVNLLVGYQDENEVSQVVFDFSAWNTAYGAGTIALSVQRSQDEWPYAVTMTVAGTNATWEISETDTAFKGTGYAQLTYTVSDVIKKSAIYRFTVYESLGANGSVVTPIQIKALFTDVEQLKLDVGTMSNLTTTEKGNLVGAVNELKENLENLETTEIYVEDTSLIINTNLVNGNEVSY